MTPEDIKLIDPFASEMRSMQYELMAKNIMKILARTGNTFRLITLEHIKQVNQYMLDVAKQIIDRAIIHDASKLVSPEKEGFDNLDDEYRKLPYGSDEFFAVRAKALPAIDHHHANNRHHVEYHKNGVMDMNLLDIIEMLVDWKAATDRNPNGDFKYNMSKNFELFNIPKDIQQIMMNTVIDLKFIQ